MTRLTSLGKVLLALGSLLCLAMPVTTQAQSAYRVEVLMFTHTDEANAFGERWRTDTDPPRNNGAISLPHGKTVLGFTRQSSDALELKAERQKLEGSPDHRVLYHAAWVQPGLGKSKAKAVRIVGGTDFSVVYPERMKASWRYDAYGETIEVPAPSILYEIDGNVKVVLGRFLHVYTDLTYRQPTRQSGGQDSGAELQDFRVQTHRRMRSNELHYLDHPLLGILVQIKPVS
ncbi:MAG: peptidoglycan binding protein CsiV [Gammaproteobacteria bacterium]